MNLTVNVNMVLSTLGFRHFGADYCGTWREQLYETKIKLHSKQWSLATKYQFSSVNFRGWRFKSAQKRNFQMHRMINP